MKKATFEKNQFCPEKHIEETAIIASLDPLKADEVLKTLPQMNASQDLGILISVTKTLVPDLEEIGHYSYYQALAAVRDLGMFAGSIKKHGVEPAQAVPALEPVLLKLGQMTDMPPRDTVLHVCLWNPEGERQRTYTIHGDEKQLIASTKRAIPQLENAIQGLILLHELPLNSPEFVSQCEQCGKDLSGMVEAVVHTMKNVSRKIFAEELRCYYDSITLQGKQYLGPGAVELPLYIFDHLLWSVECLDESYVNFKEALVPYCLPILRKVYAKFKEQPSLLAKVYRELNNAQASKSRILDGANALMVLFNILVKFRMPHKKLVDQAYVYEPKKVREKGSGGYPPEMLASLNTLTLDAREKLSENINRYKEKELVFQ
jgi:hypothetical protein